MKRILDYVTKNAVPIVLGIGIGLAIAYTTFFFTFQVIKHLWR